MSNKRNELRQKLLGNKPKAKSVTVELFGCEIELRQMSFQAIMSLRDEEDPAIRAADVIIKYGYVPGTDELLFEPTDRDTILSWPFGDDILKLQQAIASLTGVDISGAEEELKNDPLPEPSSNTPSN